MTFATDQDQIQRLLAKYFLKNPIATYHIHPNGQVSCDGGVQVHILDLDRLPVAWHKVEGTFDVSSTSLRTLEGCPRIARAFDCSHTRITNLEGGPTWVAQSYTALNCKELTSLQGLPQRLGPSMIAPPWIHLDYREDLPLLRLLTVKGLDDIKLNAGQDNNKPHARQVEQIVKRYLGKGWAAMVPCARELIRAGYRGMAKI